VCVGLHQALRVEERAILGQDLQLRGCRPRRVRFVSIISFIGLSHFVSLCECAVDSDSNLTSVVGTRDNRS
jgi:hypothetical protein